MRDFTLRQSQLERKKNTSFELCVVPNRCAQYKGHSSEYPTRNLKQHWPVYFLKHPAAVAHGQLKHFPALSQTFGAQNVEYWNVLTHKRYGSRFHR
jgi:hypothetical protein